ncbi:flagellar motor protein MotB, partial [Pseudomonadota bacterium]
MNTTRSNSPDKIASNVLATVRSGKLTQPRGAGSLSSVRQQHLNRAESEAWLMVYLDVITLLLVFFILMLSTSSDRPVSNRIFSGSCRLTCPGSTTISRPSTSWWAARLSLNRLASSRSGWASFTSPWVCSYTTESGSSLSTSP